MKTDAYGTVCNIDAGGARLRLRIGVALAIATVVVSGIVVARDVPPWWALGVFPLAYGAVLGFLQSRERT